MRLQRPPSPPPLSLPQDSDDLLNSSQPPLCTPIDQPVQHIDSVTASPIRVFAKRRRTFLNPVPPLELQPSLPAKIRQNHPRSQLAKPPHYFMPLTDDDSQPANSQSYSQRDLPDMSQDTLALFPNIVRDLHPKASANSRPSGVANNLNINPSENDPRRPNYISRAGNAGLVKASVLSTLSGSEALRNPFLQNEPTYPNDQSQSPHPPDSFVLRKIPNASESFRDLGSEMPIEEIVGTTDKSDRSLHSMPSKAGRNKLNEEKLLKLLIVSSSQGRKLSLDFVVRGIAGKGSFSEVYKVTHRLDGTMYAIKKNLMPLLTYHARKDAIQEAFALSALQGHPNIIRYHDAWFEEKGRFLLIQTEFFSTGSLYSLFIQKGRPMTAEELFNLASDISSALAHSHNQGIVHLDVKPDNIFQSNRGQERSSYVIGDFGLACHRDGHDARSTEGDSRYLCPEALDECSLSESDTDVDSYGRTKKYDFCDLRARDVFSLGVTLYELGTGVPLKKNDAKDRRSQESLSAMASEVGHLSGSDIVGDIVRRCLEPDPRRRAAAGDVQRICRSHGSLDAAKTRHAQQRRIQEVEQRLEDCKVYLSSLLKQGEAGREQYRRKRPRTSSITPSRPVRR